MARELATYNNEGALEFCEEKIKDIIISARKQNLIMNLEQDLLNDARENGQYIIY